MEESKQILMAISKLETTVTHMNAKIDEMSSIQKLALQTEQSAKSAHNRIDDLKIDFVDKLQNQKEDYEEKILDQKENLIELKSHITWLWRTVATGAIGLIFYALQFLIGGK